MATKKLFRYRVEYRRAASTKDNSLHVNYMKASSMRAARSRLTKFYHYRIVDIQRA